MTKPATTLEGLIAEDPYTNSSGSEDGDVSGSSQGLTSTSQFSTGKHTDVSEDEGWITIPYNELPDSWTAASDIHALRSLDRPFVFPGEQLHILVCLSASQQVTEIITPFKVAAVMSKNGSPMQNRENNSGDKQNSVSEKGSSNCINEGMDSHDGEENGKTAPTAPKSDRREDIAATRTLLQMEDHKQQSQILLKRFRSSNFFVRVAGLDELLWSKRHLSEQPSTNEMGEKNLQSSRQIPKANVINAAIDRGIFDGRTSSGVARNAARCYSLCNGDIVVLLQVNVGITNIKDPVLEVLQFEKYQPYDLATDNADHFLGTDIEDPCRELLHWLLPLDRALPPPRPLSPPLGSTSTAGIAHQRSTSSSSASQIFSFGHFRSYSMPSLPQISEPSASAAASPTYKPAFDLEDVHKFSPEKSTNGQDAGNESFPSFRGVSLEPQRFSVHCGLQGMYLPSRRWRRRLEIIQPIELHTFSAECSTEDLLCVQVKNVSPAHLPDIIIYVDGIAIIFEEASRGGQPLSLPIASIETGNAHSLPDLPLRRGEEHSFILKPTTPMGGDSKVHDGTSLNGGSRISSSGDQFSVLVCCRCNYTESKLFFKKSTAWRPRIRRDLLISVASEPTKNTVGPNGRVPQLPVQALTLQASNLTSEDLNLTVFAPVASTSAPSSVSLNSSPASPVSPFVGFPEIMGRMGGGKRGTNMQKLNSVPTVTESQKTSGTGGIRLNSLGQRTGTASDIISNANLGCTHLWLQSKVPLGCVPAHSSATVKLELLPMTDGIITLDTLQVTVKEKGITYKPEQPLKIYATSKSTTLTG